MVPTGRTALASDVMKDSTRYRVHTRSRMQAPAFRMMFSTAAVLDEEDTTVVIGVRAGRDINTPQVSTNRF